MGGTGGGQWDRALAAHRAGRLDEAEGLYRLVLAIEPRHAEAHHLLGVIQFQRGQFEAAVQSYRAAIALDRRQPPFHNNLALALDRLGRLDEADAAYRAALKLKPQYPEALSNLGDLERRSGRAALAVATLRRSLALADVAGTRMNLGLALWAVGQVDAALAELAIAGRGRPQPPGLAGHRGQILLTAGRSAEAVRAFEEAIRIDPRDAGALAGLAAALHLEARLPEAEAAWRAALALAPDRAEAHFGLGNVLALTGRIPAAAVSFRAAIALKPDFLAAHTALATLLEEDLQDEAAEAALAAAVQAVPDRLALRFRAATRLPRLAPSVEAIEASRARLAQALDDLADQPGEIQDPTQELAPPFFYLAYQGGNDRPLMTAAARLFRARCPALTMTARHVGSWQGPRGDRIRIGFLSSLLNAHTIGKLNQGIIRLLDRSRFEVVVIHAEGSRPDPIRAAIDGFADRAVVLPPGLAAAQQAVADLELDILHYPDIGMSAATYFLAYARLAPVQTVTWGHPVTSGLDTIDAFLSFETAETAEAPDHYTERLIRLARPGVYYQPAALPPALPVAAQRSGLGLPVAGRLYGCAQTLFKFHPDWDPVAAEILAADDQARIVLIDGPSPAWQARLRARWQALDPSMVDRILFLPRLSTEAYLQLLAACDVLIDPPHFGSGNSFYESLLTGVPTVTWSSPYLRGRLAAGLYRLIDFPEAPIVPSLADLAPTAVALARNGAADLRPRLAEAARPLFEDLAAVRGLEQAWRTLVGRG